MQLKGQRKEIHRPGVIEPGVGQQMVACPSSLSFCLSCESMVGFSFKKNSEKEAESISGHLKIIWCLSHCPLKQGALSRHTGLTNCWWLSVATFIFQKQNLKLSQWLCPAESEILSVLSDLSLQKSATFSEIDNLGLGNGCSQWRSGDLPERLLSHGNIERIPQEIDTK